jgi:hypothetical protein
MSTQQRPAPVTVVGYLNLVFGIFSLLCYSCLGIMILVLVAFFNNDAINTDPKLREMKEVKELLEVTIDSHRRNIPFFMEVTIGQAVFDIVMSLVLLISGIGLLRLRGWARQMCLVYAILSIVVRLGGMVYGIAVVQPATPQVEKEIEDFIIAKGIPAGKQKGNPMANNPIVGNLTSVFGTAFSLTYPVVVLVLMLLPNVVAAFNRPPGPPPSGPPPGYDTGADDEYFGYGGRPGGGNY